MLLRPRHTFFLSGPPRARYRHACSFRYWPAGLPHLSNDNHTPIKRLAMAFVFQVSRAATSVRRSAGELHRVQSARNKTKTVIIDAKRLTLIIPHALGATELRRRLDHHTDWALKQLENERIKVEANAWFGNRRCFSASAYGQSGSAAIQVNDDSLHVEALVPWIVSMFAPVIEAVGRHYAVRLLSDEGAVR